MDYSERRAYIEKMYGIPMMLENGETVVLTENDKKCSLEEIKKSNDPNNSYGLKRDFEQLEEVMLVHKTNYAPHDSTIESRMTANVFDTSGVFINGEPYTINLRPCRNTVHFAANHEVSPNGGGNWDDCKYAIITPLTSIPKDKYKSNCPVDTFVNGPVTLTEKAYLLCPKDEIEEMKKSNPNLYVIGYEGTSALDYANSLLWMLGYPVGQGNDWGFSSQHQTSYENLLSQNGYENLSPHYYSETKEIEEANWNMTYVVGVLELIMNTPKLHNIDSHELAKQTMLYETLCFCDDATPGFLNMLLFQIGMKESYPGSFASPEEFEQYCISLIDEAKHASKEEAQTLS